MTVNAKTRVAVVQLAFHPAALVRRRSPIEDPLFSPEADPVLEPAHGAIPAELESRRRDVRERVRAVYCEQLWLRVQAIVRACAAWQVQVLVFPEYSIPLALLERLAQEPDARTMVIVAGTHTVPQQRLQEGVYQRLHTPDELLPETGMSVCPVLLPGGLSACRPSSSRPGPSRGA